jgi:hypothetical protein
MEEITAVVENGQIKLPPELHLPDGLTVRVIWEEGPDLRLPPLEREMLTEEDVMADIRWAMGEHPNP